MRCYHTELKKKKNVTLLNERPPFNIDEYGHFYVDDSYAKLLKDKFPDKIFTEGDKGFKEAIIPIDRKSESFISGLEAKIKKLEAEIESLKPSKEDPKGKGKQDNNVNK